MTAHDRADRLEQVERQVSYHHARLELFKARKQAPGVRSAQRLHELERAYRGARERLVLLRQQGGDA